MKKKILQMHPFDQGLLQSFILAPGGIIYCLRNIPTTILATILQPYLDGLLIKCHYLSDIRGEVLQCMDALKGEREIDKMERWWILYLLSENGLRPPLYFSQNEAQLALREFQLLNCCG